MDISLYIGKGILLSTRGNAFFVRIFYKILHPFFTCIQEALVLFWNLEFKFKFYFLRQFVWIPWSVQKKTCPDILELEVRFWKFYIQQDYCSDMIYIIGKYIRSYFMNWLYLINIFKTSKTSSISVKNAQKNFHRLYREDSIFFQFVQFLLTFKNVLFYL